jgi:hypothetical protein
VDLRIVVEDIALFVLGRFAFPGLAADFLLALRLVAAADAIPLAERFDTPRLLAVVDLAFLVIGLLFPRRGFRSPVKTSTNELTALFATSTAALTFALAASPMAS